MPAAAWGRIALGAATFWCFGALVACAREGQGRSLSRPNEASPRAYDAGARESLRIPGGTRCLELLEELGIQHRRLEPTRGMQTPVAVTGPIGAVRYVSQGRPTLVCDCRLALALHWSATVLSDFGVSEVAHLGAYAYRTTRSGRLSLHARGLALDVAALRVHDRRLTVVTDFARGLGDGCRQGAPTLNQVACRLRRLRLFRELITPDHDRDHHDHLHLAIVPL